MCACSYREKVTIKDGVRAGEVVEVLHVIGVKATNYKGSGLLSAALHPPTDPKAASTLGIGESRTQLRLAFEQPGHVTLTGSTPEQEGSKPKYGPHLSVVSFQSALETAAALPVDMTITDQNEDIELDVEKCSEASDQEGMDVEDTKRTDSLSLLERLALLEREKAALQIQLQAEIEQHQKLKRGQSSSQVIVREAVLKAVTVSHILPDQQIIEAQIAQGLRKATKLSTAVDTTGQTEKEGWSTKYGAAAVGGSLQKLQEKQDQAKVNKAQKAQATVKAKQRADAALLTACKIAEPLIDEFLSGQRELDVQKMAQKPPDGLSADSLKAICKHLRMKLRQGSKKKDIAEKVAEVLKARKQRLDAAGAASVVEVDIMTRNVAEILMRPATYTSSMLLLRKPALLACAQYVLFEMDLEPYGGFVRDGLIREDWHPHMDLDVYAASC